MDGPLLHFANILYLASYSVRDILWLRLLTVAAMLCLGWCYWTSGNFSPFAWQSVFLAINVFQIWLLILERRPVKLTPVQKKLHEGPLRTLTARQVVRFTDKAQWSTIAPGQTLLAEDIRLENLILLLSGSAIVKAKGKQIARIGEGHFAGEMSFLTGGNTSAEVIADSPSLIAKWPEQYITELMQRDRELGSALQAALGTDLVRKLIKSRE
jgi:hypothetical protein